MRTYAPNEADIERAWHVVDADGLVLGRMATEVATILRGKHKPTFAPNADVGDHVIIINADKVVLTSNKAERKPMYSHSGYPGGLKTAVFVSRFAGDDETRISEMPAFGDMLDATQIADVSQRHRVRQILARWPCDQRKPVLRQGPFLYAFGHRADAGGDERQFNLAIEQHRNKVGI